MYYLFFNIKQLFRYKIESALSTLDFIFLILTNVHELVDYQ